MLRSAVFLASVMLAGVAHAGSVFLNGVNIDGVTNQTFANCSVAIDQAGNILITATGYAVVPPTGQPVAQNPAGAAPPATGTPTTPLPAAGAASPSTTPAVVPGALTQHYWLVTEKAAPGMSQYDLEVFINSKLARRFLDDEEHLYLDVTKLMQPGQNKVVIVARKNLGTGRRSSSPQHYFRVILGEGEASGRTIMLSRRLVDYRRTALETKDFNDDFYVTAN